MRSERDDRHEHQVEQAARHHRKLSLRLEDSDAVDAQCLAERGEHHVSSSRSVYDRDVQLTSTLASKRDDRCRVELATH